MEQQESATEGSANRQASLLDAALVLAENLPLLLLGPLIAGLIALGITFFITPTYTGTARLLPPQAHQSSSAAMAMQLGAIAGLIGGGAGIKGPADLYLGLLKSRTIFDAMVERFKLKQVYKTELLESARRELAARARMTAGIKDNIITIEVDDHDPKRAADMANAFVEELRKLTTTLAVTEAAQRRLFFEGQLKQAKDNLTQSEVALRGSSVSEATLKSIPSSVLEVIARLKAQITAQEIKLASMRSYMADSNAEMRLALQELAAMRAELAKAEQSTTLKPETPGADYIARFRDFKYHETLFELMTKQYDLARLDEAREGVVIQVVDEALTPERKSKPRKAQIAVIVTLATFLLLVLMVLLRQAVRNASSDAVLARKIELLRVLVFRWRRT